VQYTQIFTANRELIRDPDLIYPGQILALPDGTAAE
jgi:nucleoid-associated protein YgaU